MRRALLNVALLLLGAGIIGTALTVIFWDDDEPLVLGRPTGTPVAPTPRATPTPAPTPTPTPTPEPAETPTPAPSPPPPPSPQPALEVDCDRTPSFCTPTTGGMIVEEERLRDARTATHDIDYSNVPQTTMTWRILRGDGQEARRGDVVRRLELEVEIRNDTDRTFVFPRREVALIVLLDGNDLHRIVTNGESFTMPPRGQLNARFDVPIAFDGTYSWRAKTWFYEQR